MRGLVIVFGLAVLVGGCDGSPVERYVSARECAIAGQLDSATCNRLITAANDRYYASTRRYASLNGCIAAVDGACHSTQVMKKRLGRSNARLCERQADGRYAIRPLAYLVRTGSEPHARAVGPELMYPQRPPSFVNLVLLQFT